MSELAGADLFQLAYLRETVHERILTGHEKRVLMPISRLEVPIDACILLSTICSTANKSAIA